MARSIRTALRNIPELGKYALVLLTVVFIAFLFPNVVRFGYQYEQGAVWGYEDLYAPYDFPVRKSEAEIQAETAQLQSEIAPCYVMDPQIAREQKAVFEQAFQQQLTTYQTDVQFGDVVRNQKKYLDYGMGLLDRLFKQGVIEPTPEHLSSGPNLVINVIRGNTTQRQTLQSLLDMDKAQSFITDSLPYSRLAIAEFLLPILPDAVIPNLFYDDSLTQRFRAEQMSSFVAYRGIVLKNELIVSEGQIITEEVYQKLNSFEEAYQAETVGDRSVWMVLAGYLILTSLIIGIFVVYLRMFARPIFDNFSWLVFILMWLLGYSYLVYAVEQTDVISLYIIPFSIAPIVTRILYSDRLALFTHLVVVMLATFLSSMGFEFALLQLLAGVVAIAAQPDGRDWSKLFRALIFMFLTFSVGYLGISFVETGTLVAGDGIFFAWIFLSVFLTLLAYPLVPLLGRIFRFTSDVQLMELSDLNRPLLKELAVKAPGTLQHSLQVAHLAESAAEAIGANALLVKVGAFYHDIGKTANPEYFIENQTASNPHENEDCLESAEIIIKHVTEGYKMAKKAHLPEVINEFILTHHGTTRVEYFYRNYLNRNPEGEEMESRFRYPGPRPKTKEQAILMLADSLEAASKSLKSPTDKDIDDLVEKIIAGKIGMGQLEESELSFEDLAVCREVFKSRLRSMYHVRIKYPEAKKKN